MTDEEKTNEEKSLKEWMAEEKARLDKGFTYDPPPPSSPSSAPSSAGQVAAGLGLGAGVVAGSMAPHPDSVTFEGRHTNVIVTALKQEIANEDNRAQVGRSGGAVIVTILQSQSSRPHQFTPALTATFTETSDTLTVTVSDLSGEAKRGTLGSVGRTVVRQGKRLVSKRRGIGGLIQAAGDVMESVEDLVEDIQDLGLPKRVWEVIDRVGQAAEQAYLEEKRIQQDLQWQREAAERAWTHCESCGRAYRDDEPSRVDCPACGGVRGNKPDWL